MNGFLSRRKAIAGAFGAFVALLKGVSISSARSESAHTIAKRIPDALHTTTYSYDPRTGELVSSTTYDELGRVVTQTVYGHGPVDYATYFTGLD
jgi:hypothetical protein